MYAISSPEMVSSHVFCHPRLQFILAVNLGPFALVLVTSTGLCHIQLCGHLVCATAGFQQKVIGNKQHKKENGHESMQAPNVRL